MKYLSVCVVICLALPVAYGLKCYTCDGSSSLLHDEGCGDDFAKNESLLVECSAEEVWCRKEKTGANKIFTSVERGCADQCEDSNVAYVKRVVCCQDGDGCNGADSITGHIFLMGLLSIIAFWTTK